MLQSIGLVAKPVGPFNEIGTPGRTVIELNPPMRRYFSINPALFKGYGQAEYYSLFFFQMNYISFSFGPFLFFSVLQGISKTIVGIKKVGCRAIFFDFFRTRVQANQKRAASISLTRSPKVLQSIPKKVFCFSTCHMLHLQLKHDYKVIYENLGLLKSEKITRSSRGPNTQMPVHS